MDIRNGKILTPEEMEKFKAMMTDKKDLDSIKDMKIAPTNRQLSRKPPRVGRNDTCPCGSGAKFKKCCLRTSGQGA